MKFAIAAMYCFVLSNMCLAQNYIDPVIKSSNTGNNSWDTQIVWDIAGGSDGDTTDTGGDSHDPLSGTETDGK